MIFNCYYGHSHGRDKGRKTRGSKLRYSVYKAEQNIRDENKDEKYCKQFCLIHGLKVEDYYINDPKFPWQMTREYMAIVRKQWPYSFPPFVLKNFSEKRLEILRNNVKIAEQIYKERNKEIV